MTFALPASLFAVAVAVAASAACGSKADSHPSPSPSPSTAPSSSTGSSPPVPTGPMPKITISPASGHTSDITCNTELGKGTYGLDPDGFASAVLDGPTGTTVEIQGLTIKLDGKPVPVALAVAAVGLASPLGKSFDISLLVDGHPATLTFDGKDLATTFLREARKRPIAFPDDTAAPKFPGDVVAIMSGDAAIAFYDRAAGTERATLRDVDLVAFETTSKREDSCGHYGGGGTVAELTRSTLDADVVVYERRTGKQRAAKRFEATWVPCPASTTGEVGATSLGNLAATWDQDKELAWIQTLIQPPAGLEAPHPAPKAKLTVGGGMANVAQTTDAGTGFPTIANLAARLARDGLALTKPADVPTTWPPDLTLFANGSLGHLDVELLDFGGADKRQVPTSVQVDAQRAIYLEGSSAGDAAVVAALAARLASYHGANHDQLVAWAHSVGFTGTDDHPFTLFEDNASGVRSYSITLYRGSLLATISVVSWAHLVKNPDWFVRREGDRVLVADVSTAEVDPDAIKAAKAAKVATIEKLLH